MLVEEEKVLLASGALDEVEKKVLLESWMLDEVERMLLSSVALAESWYSWGPFSWMELGKTGGASVPDDRVLLVFADAPDYCHKNQSSVA